MGICGSTLTEEQLKQKKKSGDLDRALHTDRENESQTVKLLLLGAGESGKSTFFKQMKLLHVSGYSPDEKRSFIPVIHNNVLTSMKALIANVPRFQGQFLPENAPLAEQIGTEMNSGVHVDSPIDPSLGKIIAQLWADPGVQQAYKNRNMFQLYDSTEYYLEKIHELASPEYLPSDHDVIRCRVRTTGIVETSFNIDGVRFMLVDVGGQRNERKKWIHCFDDVTAVIFMAALSGYDLTLYEDETVNRMYEALDLFDEICNSRWFKTSAMILFLNKSDLFAEKIKTRDLNVCFPEYTGGCDYDAALRHIQGEFLGRNRDSEKPVFVHVLCATDSSHIRHVFDACKDVILRRNLAASGFVH